MLRLLAGAALFALTLACSSSSTNTGDCTSGETQQCACAGAQVGVQTCGSDGKFGSCEQCMDPSSGGSSGNGGSGGGGSSGNGGSGGGLGEGNPNACPGQALLLSGSPATVTISGDFANHADIVQPYCQFSEGMRTAVYSLTPSAPGGMTIRLDPESDARLTVSVRQGDCGDENAEFACEIGRDLNVSVKANTEYFIVVSGDRVPYTLTVTLP
ncbi:MAG: hypothetical protein R3B07_05900 [Polyangiaceae bacterium]